MKQVGKNWMKRARLAEQSKAHNDFIKSLPLNIRKLIKQRDQACAKLNELLAAGADRDIYIAQRQTYDALRSQVDEMIKEYHNAAHN